MVSSGSPSPSVPMTMASRRSLVSRGSSMDMDLSVKAMAAMRNPYSRRFSTGSLSHVHGTRNTEPMDTRMALRLSGSHELAVNSTPSMPNAAAERNMAPMFVVSTTLSITTTLLAFWHISATDGSAFLRMAQSTPRVSVYPVSWLSNGRSPTYTGISGHWAMMWAASPFICLSSQSRAMGW